MGDEEKVGTQPEETQEETASSEEEILGGGEEEETPAAEEETPAGEETSEEEKAAELKADETLGDLYNREPKLKEFLKENHHLRNGWMRAAEINKVFSTPADASTAKENSDQLMTYDGHFFSRETGSKRNFLNSLYASQVDEHGASQGHYEELAFEMMGEGLTNLSAAIRNQDPDTLQSISAFGWKPETMLDVIGAVGSMFGLDPAKFGIERAAGAPPAGAAPADRTGPDAATKKLMDEVAQLREGKKKFEASEETAFFQGISAQLGISVKNMVGKQLSKVTGLGKQPPAYRSWIEEQIAAKVNDGLRSDEYFKKSVDQIVLKAGTRTPELGKQVLAKLEQRARQLLPAVFREVMKDSGAKVRGDGDGKPDSKAGSGKPGEGTPGKSRGNKTSSGRSSGPSSTDEDEGKSYDEVADELLGI